MINVPELVEQAQHFLKLKDFKKAIEAATLLIELEEEDQQEPLLGDIYSFALQARCHAYLGLEHYEEALEDADIIVQILPYETIGYFYRSSALIYLNEIEDAKEDLNHLLSFNLSPDQRMSAHHSLGLAEYIAGNYDISIHHYVKAIQLIPTKQPLPYVNMGIVYFRLGDMAAAWNAYKTAHLLNPNDDHTLIGLAVLHASQNEWDQSLQIWSDLTRRYPYFADLEKVIHHHYRWTPPMADLVRQIAARADA